MMSSMMVNPVYRGEPFLNSWLLFNFEMRIIPFEKSHTVFIVLSIIELIAVSDTAPRAIKGTKRPTALITTLNEPMTAAIIVPPLSSTFSSYLASVDATSANSIEATDIRAIPPAIPATAARPLARTAAPIPVSIRAPSPTAMAPNAVRRAPIISPVATTSPTVRL